MSWRSDLVASGRKLSAVVAAGFIAGLFVGGVGSRLAMFVLRLTSDPSLHGMKTDDGFRIGEFTGDTGFLLLLGTASGVILAFAYFVVRQWLPEKARPWVVAVVVGVAGGAAIIRPEGIDFTLLEPLSLAVAMFVLIPAAEGWVIAVLVERFLADTSFINKWPPWLGLLPILLLAFAAFGAIVVLVIAFVVFAANRASPDLAVLWRSPPMAWIGRVALAAMTVWSSIQLVGDSVQVLT